MQFKAQWFRCCVGIGSILVSTAFAQPPAAPQMAVPPKPKQVQPSTTDELVTFDFSGGTVQNFIDKLRIAMQPWPLNVFIEPEAATQMVPPVKLTNVSYYNVLRMLDRTAKDVEGRMVQTQLEQSNIGEVSAPLFKISAIEVGGGHSKGFSVLSLNPIIGLQKSGRAGSSLDADSVLAAIGAAIEASEDRGSSPPATLRFHQPSGLLFIRGSEAQREAAQEVVQQLRRDVDAERAADQAATAGRSTAKVLLKGEEPDDLAQRLRKQFEGRCCVQFEVDGKYLIMTGDRELVNEAAQLAYVNDRAALQRKDKEATKK